MAINAQPHIFQRGDRVRLTEALTVPDSLPADSVGTVQGRPPHREGDLVVVAFDGHMLLGGVAVAAALLLPL